MVAWLFRCFLVHGVVAVFLSRRGAVPGALMQLREGRVVSNRMFV